MKKSKLPKYIYRYDVNCLQMDRIKVNPDWGTLSQAIGEYQGLWIWKIGAYRTHHGWGTEQEAIVEGRKCLKEAIKRRKNALARLK